MAGLRPGVKNEIKKNISSAKRKANLVRRASDSLLKSSTDRENVIKRKIEKLNKEIDSNSGKNNIRKFNREEQEYVVSKLLESGYFSNEIEIDKIFNALSESFIIGILESNK